MDVSIPTKTEDQNLPPMRSNNPPQSTSISQIGSRNFPLSQWRPLIGQIEARDLAPIWRLEKTPLRARN
jgi:hypothetical protein